MYHFKVSRPLVPPNVSLSAKRPIVQGHHNKTVPLPDKQALKVGSIPMVWAGLDSSSDIKK